MKSDIAEQRNHDELITTLTALTTAVDGVTLNNEKQIYIPADAAASDVWTKKLFKAPVDVLLKEVSVIPDSAIGQATNYMSLEVQNKGTSATGTTSLGTRNVNGSNTIGVTGLDMVATDAEVAEGEFVALVKTKTGDGQAWPGGLVVVKYTRT